MAISDLIRMERMNYFEKIDHWGRKDAFKKPDGGRIRFPSVKAFNRSQVILERGNITKIPPFFGRPCFGIPTAYLRHHLRPWGRARDGRPIATRCANCNISDACKLVATERLLNASDNIREAHWSFELVGGTEAMWKKHGSRHWQLPWQELRRALKSHGPFTSVNDEFIAEKCAELEAKHLADMRERKRKQRKRLEREKAKQGAFSEDFVEALSRHRIYRRVRYAEALRGGILTGRFTKLRSDGTRFDAAAWQAKTMLVFRDREPKAYSVAKEMIDQRLWGHDNVNSLRQRVQAALERIRKLERTEMADGTAVFPRLTLASLIKEITESSTYEN